MALLYIEHRVNGELEGHGDMIIQSVFESLCFRKATKSFYTYFRKRFKRLPEFFQGKSLFPPAFSQVLTTVHEHALVTRPNRAHQLAQYVVMSVLELSGSAIQVSGELIAIGWVLKIFLKSLADQLFIIGQKLLYH